MSGKVTILEWTTKNPLQQIGYNAGVCWEQMLMIIKLSKSI